MRNVPPGTIDSRGNTVPQFRESRRLDLDLLGENVHKTRRANFGEGDDAGTQWADALMHAFQHDGYAAAWNLLCTVEIQARPVPHSGNRGQRRIRYETRGDSGIVAPRPDSPFELLAFGSASMTIEFRCTSCNKLLRTSDDRAGARAKCPDCGTGITVPRPGGAPAASGGGDFDLGYEEEPAPEADRFGTAFAPKSSSRYGQSGYAADTKNCPMCGSEIKAAAVKCRHCGEMLDGGGGYSGARRYSDDEARGKVQAPAIAMLITFGLSFVILMFVLLMVAIGGGRNRQMFFPGGGGDAAFFFVMYGVQGIINVVILIGAWQMRGLKSYGMAMTASILAMIPFLSPCCLLGLPFGIWSVVTLNNPDVKNAFQ